MQTNTQPTRRSTSGYTLYIVSQWLLTTTTTTLGPNLEASKKINQFHRFRKVNISFYIKLYFDFFWRETTFLIVDLFLPLEA